LSFSVTLKDFGAHNQRVAGSSPAGPTNKINKLQLIAKHHKPTTLNLVPIWFQVASFRASLKPMQRPERQIGTELGRSSPGN